MSELDIRLIATDLDGTFLGEKSRLIPQNGSAFQLAHYHGIQTAIASGRLAAVGRGMALALGLESCHIIGLNGAQIYPVPFGDNARETAFPDVLRDACFDVISHYDCLYNVYTSRAVYTNGKAEMYGDTTRRDFVGMEAGEDSGVDMLFTFDENGKRTGMFLNVACPSQIMESTYVVSSDFAGATRELLKKQYGEDFRMIYQISPAGCQSPRDLVRHYVTEPDFWHEDGVTVLAQRLLSAVSAAEPEKVDYSPVFKHISKPVSLPRRRASYQDYVAAEAELERLTAIMPEKEAFEAFCAETHANEKIDGHGPYDS
ncbi:MAG: hypothetical protein EOM58_02555, partial [Clostridia bacterium]|nr:hypothetical protein [Clostridia bacterium]